ncbi:MFS siderochrome iron transporter 1 [Psilocybe cubensis]|uniref:MFS siderochrome iron transporter 1 n=2 Tax=Psilocybe cubensis TaxID=181762 RepID=A0ACB8GYU6_PSICU|nr:MFS siderochrome iron transporter 1 [Psilocybe cubensis]KAH9480918.1 MFS siderochrome iron transporter 1 [Psilocybe cubensis]
MAVSLADDIENKMEIPNNIMKAIDADSPFQLDTGDAEYANKCLILNGAIQKIGMGKYQWRLFMVTGFGYFSGNAWMVATNLILPTITPELTSSSRLPYLTLGQNIGLLVGAAFWGVAADIWGRKISFTLTLLMIGIFSLCGVFSNDYPTLIGLGAAWSVGVGGNLPVDSSIFLGRGKDLEAISVVKKVGEVNGKEVELNVDALASTGDHTDKVKINQPHDTGDHVAKEEKSTILLTKCMPTTTLGTSSAIMYAKFAILDWNRVKPLFATKKLAYSTSLLIILWGTMSFLLFWDTLYIDFPY